MFCPKCNATLPDNAISCPHCGSRFGQPQYFQQSDADAELVSYLIPTRATVLSIVAGYLGLFSVLVLPAPIAFIFGLVALAGINKRQRNGEKIGGKGRAIFAIVMGAIFTLLPATAILLCLGIAAGK